MDSFSLTTSLLVFFVTLVYLFFKYKFSYWSRHNVAFIPPKIPFGNINGIGRRIHSSQLMHSYYKRMKGKGPICGIYVFTSPAALALDLDLIKNVLIKDFNYFHKTVACFTTNVTIHCRRTCSLRKAKNGSLCVTSLHRLLHRQK